MRWKNWRFNGCALKMKTCKNFYFISIRLWTETHAGYQPLTCLIKAVLGRNLNVLVDVVNLQMHTQIHPKIKTSKILSKPYTLFTSSCISILATLNTSFHFIKKFRLNFFLSFYLHNSSNVGINMYTTNARISFAVVPSSRTLRFFFSLRSIPRMEAPRKRFLFFSKSCKKK